MTFCLSMPEFGAVGSGFILIGLLVGCLIVCCSQRWCLTWTSCCGGWGCCAPCCLSGFSDKSKLASEERLIRISINNDEDDTTWLKLLYNIAKVFCYTSQYILYQKQMLKQITVNVSKLSVWIKVRYYPVGTFNKQLIKKFQMHAFS